MADNTPSTVRDLFDAMSYGPAPEGDAPVRAWLDAHAARFGLYINGAWLPTDDTITVHDPSSGRLLADVAQGSAADIDRAVAAARAALSAALGQLKGRGAAAASVIYAGFGADLTESLTEQTVLATLESLGYCGPGEGPDFVAGQRTAPGGNFPLNTSGGGLSYTHPGMYGIFLLVEAVRQLRGECGERQIASPKISLVNGTGGQLSSTGTCVLAVD